MSIVLIALGSNLGNRSFFLDSAIERLRAEPGFRLVSVSSYYETDPVGGPSNQNPYLNAVAQVETNRTPPELLKFLLETESTFGRVRSERNAPRTLDLDLLLYDQEIWNSDELTLPHPRMHERRFVLVPLAEIASGYIHPILQRSISDLLSSLPPEPYPPRKYLPPEHLPPRKELDGFRAVVTGSTSGIGKAIALELAKGGALVIIHGRKTSEEKARVVANEIRSLGQEAEICLANLNDPNECNLLIESAFRSENRPIDIWINNAGSDTLTGEAAHWSFDRKLQELLSVDVVATMRLSRAVGEKMQRARGGAILTIGWDQAETGMEGDSGQLFATIKGAIHCFTKSLAKSLAPKVRVNCIAPGWIRTAWGETASPYWQDRVKAETSLRRWGLPEDIARTARWLVSPSASYITGQIIRVNGGII